MLVLVGVVLLLMGLISGAALLAAAFGATAVAPGLLLWITFPGLCLGGFGVIGMSAGVGLVRKLSLVASGLLLLMALASLGALVFGSAGLLPAAQSTTALWYVLLVGLALGTPGAAVFGRRPG